MVSMRVLIACEHSGTIRDAFSELGHDAWSCDLLPTLSPGNHIQGDVLNVLSDDWDMMVAHPPCTYLSYAGMAHWHKPGRAEAREAAMTFFMQLINAPIPFICVENPRGLPCQRYRKPDQVIHPYMFGDPQLKRTCLWLKNLPPLWYGDPGGLWPEVAITPPQPIYTHLRKPSRNYKGGELKSRYFVDSKGKRGDLLRSRTFQGVALAMAQQWGILG
jgi:hypothetical protein